MRRLLAAALMLAAVPAAAEPDHATIARAALDAHILPGFERLAEAAAVLSAEADAACAGAGAIDPAAVEDAYRRTFDAWARIGHIRFGPAEEDSTGFAVEFWPDTKGSIPRTLAAMTAAEDPVVDDPQAFASVSVAARGLMALDELLFDPESGPIAAESYRCRLLVAITRDLAATAARLVARWRDPWGGILTSAGAPGNPVYFSPAEATRALFSALHDGLQYDIDLRLGRPLGTAERPQPRRAEAWRSGRSLPNLIASLEGLRAFSDTVFAPAVGPDAAAPVDAAFAAALAAAGELDAPIDVAVATVEGRARVEALQDAVRHVQEEVASHIGPAVGVTSGFNAMDGD
jgi:predicted lipoprotein